MTYNEAVEKINSLLVFGAKPGLERISELIQRLGSPDKQLKFVHIAGTNGKGSTCALLANTLTQAGYRTGMFISPYVLEFRERFQIDGKMIPEQELAETVELIYPVVEQMKAEGKIITEFELVFAVAVVWYAKKKCDVVVLETGLGGRFDATNIIDTPLVSVITSVSLDHTAILGDTYEKIAAEKCGIIKENGITVAYGEQQGRVLDVISDFAQKKNNILYVANPDSVQKISSNLHGLKFVFTNDIMGTIRLTIPFIGEHQLKNAAAALYTISALRTRGLTISDTAVQNGFAKAFFPARLELIAENPIVLLDGAHNPGGAAALAAALSEYLNGRKKTAIVGMLADKDIETVLWELVPLFENVITVEPHNPRALSSSELAALVRKYNVNVFESHNYTDAYQKALSLSGKDDAVVIFGSLYLASDMRKCLLNDEYSD